MHKIRHMNKILSIFLCVVVLFCALSAPFTANAVVGVDDVICYTIATICLSLGASIAFNNPNTGEEILNYCENIWNHLDPFTQEIIKSKIVNVGGFVPINDLGMWYSAYVNWSTSEWQQIGSDIISYFNGTGSGSTDPQYQFLTVNPNSSGKIGFTKDSAFSISMPSASVKNDIYQVDLGKSYLYFGRIDQSILSGLFPEMGIPTRDAQYPMFYSNIMNDDGFTQVECLQASTGSMYPAGYFVSQYSKVSDKTGAEGYFVSLKDDSYYIRLFLHPSNTWYTKSYILWYDENNITYNLTTYTGAGGTIRWAFVSTVDGAHYKNMDFSSYHAAICWFAQTCGLAMPNSTAVPDDYVAHPAKPANDVIDLDPSKATENLNNQISSAADDTINSVVAGNIDDLKILADDPALITNPTAAADAIVVYPSDLPAINATGNFWTTKFPFCLPWDIYNLITGFSAPEQAPVLHFLVFPADAFGIGISDTYIDINFADYYEAVQIFRFFIKIEVVLGIILITKRLIK